MELFEARDHYIVQNGENALWCNRFDGTLTARKGEDICTAWNPTCLGLVHGVMGKIKLHQEAEWKLVLIRNRDRVGVLPGNQVVYKVSQVAVLPLSHDEAPRDLQLEMCRKHHFGMAWPSQLLKNPDSQQKALQKTWNSIKSAAENVKTKKRSLSPAMRELKDREKFDKRILDELQKMFCDDSFFYCPDGDLTSSLQRQNTTGTKQAGSGTAETPAAWERADDRFFWNKYMLDDLIQSNSRLSDPWIVPIIQGYVQIEMCAITFREDDTSADTISTAGSDKVDDSNSLNEPDFENKMAVVSRRSRYRAGTRYKKRGVDADGNCANYVETEQLMEFKNHLVSFVQVRGSVPLYWSQTGIKYKPPPRIEKGERENQAALAAHFDKQIELYSKVCIVSTVDQAGKEKPLADAFLQHVLQYNNEQLTYVSFDFHEYCRGMKFENVSILTENIMDIIKEMRYCWLDDSGMICDQRGVFRVNCLDCLDRTNVVQSAIARIVLEVQCRKLGLLPPDTDLPARCRHLIQQMWANNGDSISRQYAGTAALKGDFTRTGERKISGMMKDGVNSASRYYINRVRDIYRQATMDLVLGRLGTEDQRRLMASSAGPQDAGSDSDDSEAVEKEENMKTLIDECKKMLISEPETCLGCWGLVDCDPVTGDPTQMDMDMILLLTQRAYYVANYDDDLDMVTRYQKIYLEDLTHMEIGPAPALFKSKYIVLRVHYTMDEETGFFHSFRTTNTRLFNNMLIHNEDEVQMPKVTVVSPQFGSYSPSSKEMLRGIYESFLAAKKFVSQELPLIEGKLDRRRSKSHMAVIDIASQAQELMDAAVPSTQLAAVPSDSSSDSATSRPSTSRQAREAITNLGRTFAGLNPVKKIKFNRLRPPQGLMPTTWYSKLGGVVVEGGVAQATAVVGTGGYDDDDGADISPAAGSSLQRSLSTTRRRAAAGYDMDIMESRVPAGNEDSSSSSSEGEVELETAGGEDGHVFLESCGMLNTTTRQLVHALLPPTHGAGTETNTSHNNQPLQHPNTLPAGAKSLVTGDKVFKRFNSFPTAASSKTQPVAVMAKKKPMFSISPSLVASDDNDSSPSQTKLAVPVTRKVSRSVNDMSSFVTLDAAAERTSASQIDITMSVSAETETKKRAPTTQPSIDETWVNVNVTSGSRGEVAAAAGLHHPMMKISLSEGSSLMRAASTGTEGAGSMEEVTISPGDLAAAAATMISPFSKLRIKMTSLAGAASPRLLSGISSPGSLRRRGLIPAAAIAAQNRRLAEARYRHCKTTVILL